MINKNFNYCQFESFHYNRWEKAGFFQPQQAGSYYTISLPPPNVTGSLHVGHALNHTLQDVLVRYQRMKGKSVLWQPGTDHAGIATQMVVERHLAEKKIEKRIIGREQFEQHIWQWKNKYGGRIITQQRRLGASCDWSRQRFTMDSGLLKAVSKVFIQLYNEGLIYRDQRLVNWDTKLKTALSDLEVENREIIGKLYYICYPFAKINNDIKDCGIIIATTRPETLFGDMAVAIHPNDKRYKHLIGTMIRLPIIDRLIPIIADNYVDPEQGSGVVKITPAHDFNDFKIGKRHNLPCLSIIDKNGCLNDQVPTQFTGMKCFTAREKLVAELDKLGLLKNVTEHKHIVPHGDRSNSILEPLLTEQWYLNAKILAQPAIKAVEEQRIRIIPETERNRFFSWMRDIQPWCISRQLWWGHRIPVWYGPDGQIFVNETEQEAIIESRIHYGCNVHLNRETDVLDTWFSSALWPFSALGWPENNSLLHNHYPNDILITGTDILFFWVARMMMMGLHFMQNVPFYTVLIHGLVRDEVGRKMSKTAGNVINPLALCKASGTDTLRLTLCGLTVQGRDIKLSNQRLEGYRNFITKLWNASRFLEQFDVCLTINNHCPLPQLAHNHWILRELMESIIKIDRALTDYRFNDYIAILHHLVWNRYCDWYLELIKPILKDSNNSQYLETITCAGYTLGSILKLLHPVAPFVTEELLYRLSNKSDSMLINALWPNADAISVNHKSADLLEWLIKLISTIRSIKVNINIMPADTIAINCNDFTNCQNNILYSFSSTLQAMKISLDNNHFPNTVYCLLYGKLIRIHLTGNVDLQILRLNIDKKMQKYNKLLQQTRNILDNVDFVNKAPTEVLDRQRSKYIHLQQKINQYETILENL